MMRIAMAVVICGLIVAAGCSSEKAESVASTSVDLSRYDKVAIVDVSGAVYGEAVKNQITDLFAMELTRKGYLVIERAKVQKILEEQKFQSSELTTSEGAARAGRLLNVPAVLLINIPRYEDEKLSMTAKLVDVEQGSIIWIGEGSGTTGRTMATILGAAAGAVIGGAAAGGDSSDRTIGAIAGGVLGGVAGHALSPEQQDQVKKVIQKVCKDLPSRLAGTASKR